MAALMAWRGLDRAGAPGSSAGWRAATGLAAAAALTLSWAGCSDGDVGDAGGGGGGGGGTLCTGAGAGGFGVDRDADMEVAAASAQVKHNDTLALPVAGLKPGAEYDTTFRVRNVAQLAFARELRIEKVELVYSTPAGATDESAPFACLVASADGELPCDQAEVVSLVPDGAPEDFCTSGRRQPSAEIKVRFRRQSDDVVRQALLRITTSGDDQQAGGPFLVKLTTKQGSPRLKLSPEVIDFGTVKIGASATKKLTLLNSGDAPLVVSKLIIAKNNPKPIAVEVGEQTFQGGAEAKLEPPLTIAPDGSAAVLVTFSAVGGDGYIDALEVHSNDAESPHKAKLVANQNLPCLKVVPAQALNFGFVPLGTTGTRKVRLESCGSSPVEISAMAVQDDKEATFGLDLAALPLLGGKPVSAENPIKIGQNESVEVDVQCTPAQENKDPDTGKPAPYTASITLSDNTIAPDKSLELSCWGTATNCPTAIIEVPMGEQIVPQAELQLIGANSFAGPNQKVVKWAWKVVKAPKGAEADHTFWPNANAPDVLFGAKTSQKDFSGAMVEVTTVNIAGEYVFELEVTDDAGNTSCQKALQTVLVIPDEDIHVELLWDTPADTDKGDKGLGAGADMDLHFAHATAEAAKVCTVPAEICPNGQPCKCQQDLDKDGKPDPFFHSLYDCFWFNADPNWADPNPATDDNPRLDLDDTDGWGPENLNLKLAENGVQYTIGVHYWDAHSYGDSVATVRIYILGVLKAELVSQTMSQCDLWWVKKIDWPSGDLVDLAGPDGKLTPKYFPLFSKTLGAKCSD